MSLSSTEPDRYPPCLFLLPIEYEFFYVVLMCLMANFIIISRNAYMEIFDVSYIFYILNIFSIFPFFRYFWYFSSIFVLLCSFWGFFLESANINTICAVYLFNKWKLLLVIYIMHFLLGNAGLSERELIKFWSLSVDILLIHSIFRWNNQVDYFDLSSLECFIKSKYNRIRNFISKKIPFIHSLIFLCPVELLSP